MSETQQQQFDWEGETAKCVEGLKFDLDQDYTFELVFEGVSLHNLVRKDGEVITYKKGEKMGQPVKMFTFPFKEVESNVEFKLDYFHNDSYRVNPQNPELEDDIVKLSRKLGYDPVLGGNFRVKDFIKPGVTFTARLKELPPSKDNKVYKTIDLDTISLGESAPHEKQAKVDDIPAGKQKEILALAKGCKKFNELVSKINKSGKVDELLDAAMRLKENGTLTF